MAQPTDIDRLISSFSEGIRRSFEKNRRIMSFAEYMQLVTERPNQHFRSAAQYIRDAFDHFGTYAVKSPRGELRRFRLFDGLEGSTYYLVGQEEAQDAVYRILNNFIREGRINRLVLLHGPNGSAKSSLVACVARALELYSQTEVGALYKFNWIFPTEKISRGQIGFGGERGSETSTLPTYAYLEDLEVNARLSDEIRDSPLFLLPENTRQALLDRLLGNRKATDGEALGDEPYQDGFNPAAYVLRGDLSDKNKRIYEALLASYHGDYGEVLKHVQVERLFLSRRYRVGLATVGPQMRVDAGVRQITADKSLAALPASLQSLTLYEPYGDLVDGNRGMVEFNDLLKRPMELNRYLLSTSETGLVPLETCTLHLDAFLIGTVNESYLDALKGQPDWTSYKGRIELVRMPYLLDFETEKKIYDVQLEQVEIAKPVAPHVTELAAMWAVLTRLRRPRPEGYPEIIRDVLSELSPLEKARLYAHGSLSEGLSAEEVRELTAVIGELYTETAGSSDYEGRFGASPRELKTILLNAAHSTEHPCFSPLALFRELERLVSDPSVYEFLQLKADGDYHVPKKFIDVVTELYLDEVDHEVRSAMGLIEEAQYEQLFARYVDHVNHAVKGEKRFNPVSRKYEPPDERFMSEVEEKLGVEGDIDEYRQGIISAVGAFRVEHPTEPVDFIRIFKRHLEILRRQFFSERRDAIHKIKMNVLRYFDEEELPPSDEEPVLRTLKGLKERFGYTNETVREAIGFLVRRRYDNED